MRVFKVVLFFLRCILIFLPGILLLTACILFLTDYNKFCYILLSSLGKLHRINEFQQQLLTPSKYSILRFACLGFALIFTGLSVYVWRSVPKIIRTLLGYVAIIKQKLLQHASDFTPGERKTILLVWLIITGVNVYNCISLPISYDEAWTYLNLSSKNLFVSASYYPAPNNHILFSLLSNITCWLPIDSKIAVRLPNVLTSAVSFFVILLILKDIFYPSLAIILTALFFSFYPVMLYSTHARGYLLYMLFTAITFYFFCKNRNQNKRTYWILFGITACLGFYTIPSYLYAFTTILTIAFVYFIVNKNMPALKALFITSTGTAIGVIILYTPVFLVSGLKAVTSNAYVIPKTTTEVLKLLPGHIKQTMNWYFGGVWSNLFLVVGILLLLMLAGAFYKKEKRFLAASVCVSFILPVFYMLLHRTVPFERTWSYLLFFLILSLGILFQLVSKASIIRKWVFFFSAIILFLNFIVFYQSYPVNYAVDFDSKKLSDYLMANNCHTMYIQSDYQEVLLYYYYTLHQQQYTIDNGYTGAVFDQAKQYDCLILLKNTTVPVNLAAYRPVDISDFISVYLKK